MQRSKVLFHPLFVLACAALVMLGYVALMRWRFPGGDLSNNFFYVLPIIIPFVAFLFDRAKGFREAGLFELGIDCGVVMVSIMRSFGLVPLVSGHVLFLIYAMSRPGSRLTKLTAVVVMFQVIYLKALVWHDPVSPLIGFVLGELAALAVRRLQSRGIAQPLTPLRSSK